ncbi:MAG TPA: AtpZ/AtpI family protein [Candidatus Saccharimonadales bacterium]|nr:AtpZ/AtpI family protein [Candidatus Saccharimonadales bacterium]
MSGSKNGDKAPSKTRHDPAETAYKQRSLFIALAANMTWQLAVAVLLPLLGGYYLDRHFHTAPWLLIAGCVLAVIGVIGVMINIVRLANRQTR